MSSPARIVCVPSADASFATAADRIADSIPAEMDAVSALNWFSVELAREFPDAVVHEQDELARMEGGALVWYVTRRQRLFRIDVGVLVALGPEDAYRVYVEHMTEWQSAVALTPKRVTPEVAGTEYLACYTFMGREFNGVLRIVTADRGRSL